MQIEEADVAGKIRLHAFTSSEEKIPNKILLCSFMLFFLYCQYVFKYEHLYKCFSW